NQLCLDGKEPLLQVVVQDLRNAMPLLLLCPSQLESQGADLLLSLHTFGYICRDDRYPTKFVGGNMIDGKLNGHTIPTGGLQTEFTSRPLPPRLIKDGLKSLLLFRWDQILKPGTN